MSPYPRHQSRPSSYAPVVAILTLLAAAACDSVGSKDDKSKTHFSEILQHMDTFAQEASARGLDFKAAIDGLDVSVHEVLLFDGQSYCGYVPLTASGDYSKRVLFSTQDECWGDHSEWYREAIVFHELGHVVLGRGHSDSKLPDGSWSSIMKSKTGSWDVLYADQTIERRRYYVDELFLKDLPVPDWALSD